VIRCRNDETITVTPIDANHCPGAAMFMFEGQFGRILYTGDFRYSGPMLNDMGLYSSCTGIVDVLYLDNTFCDARCIFPSREEATVEILRLIHSYPDACIKIGLRTLGKEELLVQIAHSIGEWIGVSEERLRTLQMLCMPNVFEVESSHRIQVVMMAEITDGKMRDWNAEHETIAIVPTALGVALHSFTRCNDIHVVPYSDHCSYKELQQFVSVVKPRKILPILGPDFKDRLAKGLPNRADMSCFQVNMDDDHVLMEENNLSVLSKQQDSACSSHNTNIEKTTVGCTQPKIRKMTRRKGCFSFKKKAQMGVTYMSSESPIKRTELSVVAAADSVGIVEAAEHSQAAELDADVALPVVICSDADDNTCDATADSREEENQHSVLRPVQHDSVHSTSDDRNLSGEKDAASSSSNQDTSALNFDSLDNAWMLRILEPLITQEAEKIKRERQSFRR